MTDRFTREEVAELFQVPAESTAYADHVRQFDEFASRLIASLGVPAHLLTGSPSFTEAAIRGELRRE